MGLKQAISTLALKTYGAAFLVKRDNRVAPALSNRFDERRTRIVLAIGQRHPLLPNAKALVEFFG